MHLAITLLAAILEARAARIVVLFNTRMLPEIEVVHVASAADARHFRDLGYCPVECAFGSESVVDDLRMDHHGELASLEPVSLRAYRDVAWFRAVDPRFVVAGAPDADATFALAALSGAIAHPRAERTNRSATRRVYRLRASWSGDEQCFRQNLAIALTIAKADLDPFSERWEETTTGVLLLCYKQEMQNCPHDAASFRRGVDLWKALTAIPAGELMTSVQSKERERVRLARGAAVLRVHPQVAFVESPVWGWDVWYSEIAPVIVAYQAKSFRCSIGCRDSATAQALFGPVGLLSIADRLDPPGWGGRQTIIGSPRGHPLTRDEAIQCAVCISEMSHICPPTAPA